MRRFARRRVELAVTNAGAGAHPLQLARAQYFAIAEAIAMFECPAQDDRDNFHIAMPVHAKALAGGDTILIHHAQGPELRVLWIEVFSERKGVISVEPAEVEMAALR